MKKLVRILLIISTIVLIALWLIDGIRMLMVRDYFGKFIWMDAVGRDFISIQLAVILLKMVVGEDK